MANTTTPSPTVGASLILNHKETRKLDVESDPNPVVALTSFANIAGEYTMQVGDEPIPNPVIFSSVEMGPYRYLPSLINNGLVGTMLMAKSTNVPLRLRPDDVWLSIVINFGRYTTSNPREAGKLFKDGQSPLSTLSAAMPIRCMRFSDWEKVIRMATDHAISQYDAPVAKWVLPEFTTTTEVDRMICCIAPQVASKYVSDVPLVPSKGVLSKVELMGQCSDWVSLYTKASMLWTFGIPAITRWADLLLPVLNQFIALYRGQGDADFWSFMMGALDENDKLVYTAPERKIGWCMVFAAFDIDGQYLLNSPTAIMENGGVYASIPFYQIPDCSVSIPIHSTTDSARIYMGSMVTKYDYAFNSLSPCSGWIVCKARLPCSSNSEKPSMNQLVDIFTAAVAQPALFLTPEEVEIVKLWMREALIMLVEKQAPARISQRGLITSTTYFLTHLRRKLGITTFNADFREKGRRHYLLYLSRPYHIGDNIVYNILYPFTKKWLGVVTTCFAGHLLTPCDGTTLPQEDPSYNAGIECDGCGRVIPINTTMMKHCSKCMFDLCPDCSND